VFFSFYCATFFQEKADIEEANKIVLEQDAYLEDLLKTPAPGTGVCSSLFLNWPYVSAVLGLLLMSCSAFV